MARRDLRSFAINVLTFTIIFGCLDFTIGKLLEYLYFHQTSGSLYRTTFALEQTTANVLVFGSSRAIYHYVPEVVTDSLGLSCYNTGADGQKIFYYAALNSVILHRYKPKLIVLDVNPDEFNFSPEGYDRLNILLPYYSRHQEIRRFVDLRSPFERLKLLSRIYPYNSDLLTIGAGNLATNKSRHPDEEGYIPLDQLLDTALIKNLPRPAFAARITLDSNKLSAYSEFIRNTIGAGVPLVVVMSPAYGFHGDSSDICLLKAIAARNHAPFLDYLRDNRYNQHPELFSDVGHLNREGAFEFTRDLVRRLRGEVPQTVCANTVIARKGKM